MQTVFVAVFVKLSFHFAVSSNYAQKKALFFRQFKAEIDY